MQLTLRYPTAQVLAVISSVMTLLDESIEWDLAKKVLNKREFIKRLTKFDRKNVNPIILQKLKEHS